MLRFISIVPKPILCRQIDTDASSLNMNRPLRYIQTNVTRLKVSKSDCFQCGFSNVDNTACPKSLFVAFSRIALLGKHP